MPAHSGEKELAIPVNRPILLLDPNFSADPISTLLQSKGFSVIRVGNSSPRQIVSSEEFVNVDFANVDEVQKLVREWKALAVVPGCTDVSLRSWREVAVLTGIHTSKLPDVDSLVNKFEFWKLCKLIGIPIPKTSDSVVDFGTEHPDLLVKPRVGYSGLGVSRVTRAPHRQAPYVIQPITHREDRNVIFQEFIDGELHSVAAILRDEKILFKTVVREYCVLDEFRVDVSYVETEMDHACLSTVTKSVESLARAVKIRNGYIHVQFIVRDGEVFFLESTLRMAGDLYSTLLELSGSAGILDGYLSGFLPEMASQSIPPSSELVPILRVTHWAKSGTKFKAPPNLDGAKLIKFVGTEELGYENRSPMPVRIGVGFFAFSSLPELKAFITSNLSDPQQVGVEVRQ